LRFTPRHQLVACLLLKFYPRTIAVLSRYCLILQTCVPFSNSVNYPQYTTLHKAAVRSRRKAPRNNSKGVSLFFLCASHRVADTIWQGACCGATRKFHSRKITWQNEHYRVST